MYYVKQAGKKMVCKLYNKYFNSQRLLKNSGIIEKRPHSPGNSKKVYIRNSKVHEIGKQYYYNSNKDTHIFNFL